MRQRTEVIQKAFKIGFAVLTAAVCMAILTFVCIALLWSADFDFPATEILRETSSDDAYEVVVEQLGEPEWPFGPVTARITVRNQKNGKRIARFKEEVMNDGAPLYPSQFTVNWQADRVLIFIDPAESECIAHTIML